MENARFKSLPPITETTLPFAGDEKQLAAWLDSLALLPPTTAATHLLNAIQNLNLLDIKAETKLKLLARIHHSFPTLHEQLLKTYFDSSFPFAANAKRNVELVTWNYLALAQTCWLILRQHPGLSKSMQVLSIQLAFNSLTHALFHISLSYHVPSPGFWQLSYQLYLYAEAAEFLNLNHPSLNLVHADTPADKQCIATQFKLLLTFQLCDTQQFRARELLIIFNQLAAFAHEAVILSHYQTEWQQGVCVFQLQQDQAPHKIMTDTARTDPHERFISCIMVARQTYAFLQQKRENSTLNVMYHEALIKALNTLGLGRKRKFMRVNEVKDAQGLIGFNAVIEFLRAEDGTWKQHHQPATPDWLAKANPAKAELDLIPVGEEIAFQMHAKFSQPKQQNTSLGKIFAITGDNAVTMSEEKVEFEHFSILDSSVKGYKLMANATTTDIRIGDIVGLATQNNTLQKLDICLIRRISQLPYQGVQIGVEVMGFASKLVWVTKPLQANAGVWAIFLPAIPAIKQPESLIFNGTGLKNQDIVNIQFQENSQRYKLEKVLLINPALTIMQLATSFSETI